VVEGTVETMSADREDQEAPATPSGTLKPKRKAPQTKHPITPEELSTQPAAAKMLMNEASRLEEELAVVSRYREKFYAAQSQVEVLREKVKRFVGAEIISSTCFVISGVLLGNKEHLALGGAILLAGVAALLWMKR
jgi:hypothetical protein